MSLSVVSGILLILCGVLEGFDTVMEKVVGFDFKGHYSMFVLGMIHFIYALTDILDGFLTMEH
jgi:hypothetical protein